MTPFFSIVIANYNYGRYLGAAIDSLLAQTCQDFEIIVIDGGSTDDSVDIIKRYAEGGEGVRGQGLGVSLEKEGLGRRSRSTVEGSYLLNAETQRRRAEEKVEEWLAGVDETTFAEALEKLVAEKTAAGEYVFADEDEKRTAIAFAKRFFAEFSRKLIELKDGRYVYFVPDPRARERGVDNSWAWAEYAFHGASSGGKEVPGKSYFIRHYSDVKCENLSLVEPTIRAEHCVAIIERDRPERDAIHFVGTSTRGKRFDIVTRLDEYGNVDANLSEVTVVMTKKKYTEKNPPPVFRPLTEVVEAVAKHQAAGFSPSTTVSSVANPSGAGKGGEGVSGQGLGVSLEKEGLDRRSRSTVEGKITYWVSEPDKGQSDAFNKGFAKARGEFITWLNADDVLLPRALEAVKAKLVATGADWATGNLVRFNMSTRKLIEVNWGPHLLPRALQGNGWPIAVYGPTTFWRRSVYEKLGPMDESCYFSMDTEYWTRLYVNGYHHVRVNEFCWAFGMHDDSKTAEFGTHQLAQETQQKQRDELRRIGEKLGYRTSRAKQWIHRLWRILDGSLVHERCLRRKWLGRTIDELIAKSLHK